MHVATSEQSSGSCSPAIALYALSFPVTHSTSFSTACADGQSPARSEDGRSRRFIRGPLENGGKNIDDSGSRCEQGVGQLFTFVYVQKLNAEFASRFEILGSFYNDGSGRVTH